MLAALGDPVRLRLLSIVAAEGEVCSCNLERPLGKSQPTISHHTAILAEAGLIVGETPGQVDLVADRSRAPGRPPAAARRSINRGPIPPRPHSLPFLDGTDH